jgi:putative membrane protein
MQIYGSLRRKDTPASLALRFIFTAGGVALAEFVVPGVDVSGLGSLALAAIVLGLFSTFLKPLLVLFALPFVVLTLGTGIALINALLFWLAGRILPGFTVDGFWPAVFGALILSIAGGIASVLQARWQFRGGIGGGPFGPGPGAGSGGFSGDKPRGGLNLGGGDVIDVESRPS